MKKKKNLIVILGVAYPGPLFFLPEYGPKIDIVKSLTNFFSEI